VAKEGSEKRKSREKVDPKRIVSAISAPKYRPKNGRTFRMFPGPGQLKG
jgi:hypothetical protein